MGRVVAGDDRINATDIGDIADVFRLCERLDGPA